MSGTWHDAGYDDVCITVRVARRVGGCVEYAEQSICAEAWETSPNRATIAEMAVNGAIAEVNRTIKVLYNL